MGTTRLGKIRYLEHKLDHLVQEIIGQCTIDKHI